MKEDLSGRRRSVLVTVLLRKLPGDACDVPKVLVAHQFFHGVLSDGLSRCSNGPNARAFEELEVGARHDGGVCPLSAGLSARDASLGSHGP
jgi:hypothetical protein